MIRVFPTIAFAPGTKALE